MDFKHLNDNKISAECNISNGLIGKARLRGSLSQINISKILIKYPELNANWLLTGRGNMIVKELIDGENYFSLSKKIKISKVDLDLIALIKSKIQIYDSLFVVDSDFLNVAFKKGDLLLTKIIHKGQLFFQYNAIYVIHTQEKVFVSKVKKSLNDFTITLINDDNDLDIEINIDIIEKIELVLDHLKFG